MNLAGDDDGAAVVPQAHMESSVPLLFHHYIGMTKLAFCLMVVPQDSDPVKRPAVAYRFQYISRCFVPLSSSKLLAFQGSEEGDRDDVVRGRERLVQRSLLVSDLGGGSLPGPVVVRSGIW